MMFLTKAINDPREFEVRSELSKEYCVNRSITVVRTVMPIG